MRLPPDTLKTRARSVRLLLLDVDGVQTDGSIVLGSGGEEHKAFYVRDGAAIVMALREGIEVGFVSGPTSSVTAMRAAELGVKLLVQGELDKDAALERILKARGVSVEDVAYMGDDLLDLPVLRRVGLSAAPADAATEVIAEVGWVSSLNGGRGAVRELVDLVLTARRTAGPGSP